MSIRWMSGFTFALLLAGCAGCVKDRPAEPFQKMVEEFVYTSLVNSPIVATQVGYHQHSGVALDALLDDYSPASVERQRRWIEEFRVRLMKNVRPETLTPDDRVDYEILADQLALSMLELSTIQNYRHNPTLYVELLGNALYSLDTLQFAPKEVRYRHLVKRLEQAPAFLLQARRNLVSSPEIWTKVAIAENEGNIALVERTLRAGVPAELKDAFEKAAGPAVAAMKNFNRWLKDDLMTRPYDWRLGAENYARKFRYVLATDASSEQVLEGAEEELRRVRARMRDIALPLYREAKKNPQAGGGINEVVSAVLGEIAKRHATPDTYFADARRDLEEATAFVRQKDLLALSGRDNLQVIETPEFMRGIYAVGGFAPAPPLEPKLGAFYWLTPIPRNWPPERVESKLREYNFYSLKLLTIHEAMPGHYVQFEYSNDVQPELRRVFRAVFANGPYVEGWAVYATEAMLEEGYLNNPPELQLTFLKQQLRMLANTILDVRLQTGRMTDEEAMRLMIDDTFQETEEATAKLQRAKLSSTQLPTYYVGWRDWRRLRDLYKASKGEAFQLKEFHQAALKPGAIPVPVLARLLTGKDLGGANSR